MKRVLIVLLIVLTSCSIVDISGNVVVGGQCQVDEQCDSGNCEDGICGEEIRAGFYDGEMHCRSDVDCFDQEVCVDGVCLVGERCVFGDNTCERGLNCVYGVCQTSLSCSDSDNGLNPRNSVGEVIVDFSISPDKVRVDSCLDDGTVIEWFCTGSLVNSMDVQCLGSETCIDGACIVERGGRCRESSECVEGLVCRNTGSPSMLICGDPAEDIAPCFNNDECLSGYCGRRGGGGSTVCVPYEEQFEVGHWCNNDESCQTDICNEGICAAIQDGGSCLEDDNCGEGSLCRDNVCIFPLENGEVCDSSEECRSEICLLEESGGRVCERTLRRLDEFCVGDANCYSEVCDPNQNICVDVLVGDCEELVPNHNVIRDGRLNVVFVGVGVLDGNDFRENIVKYINYNSQDEEGFQESLFNVEPFKSNKDRFNLWYLPEIQVPDPLSHEEGENMCSVLCNSDEKNSDSCRFRNKYTMNLCNLRCRGQASFSVGKAFQPIWIEEDKFMGGSILTHEFGHTFGKLADEYVEGGRNSRVRPPNCAPDMATAVRWWGDLIGQGDGDNLVGYFNGCAYVGNNIKPTEDSMMTKHRINDFGLVNYRELCYRILLDTRRVGNDCMQVLEEAAVAPYERLFNKFTGEAVDNVASEGIKSSKFLKSIQKKSKMTSTQKQDPTEDLALMSEHGLKIDLVKFGDKFEIKRIQRGDLYPYIERLEQGVFDSEFEVRDVQGKVLGGKGANLICPTIVEDFKDDGTIELFDYVEEDCKNVLVRIPLNTQDVDNFKINFVSKSRKIDENYLVKCKGEVCTFSLN